MKKLLVLSLVLGIASLATAGLALTPGATGFTYDSDLGAGTFSFIAVEASIVDADGGDLALTALGAGNLSYINAYGMIPAGGFTAAVDVDAYVWAVNVAGAPTTPGPGEWAAYAPSATEFVVGDGAAWLVADDAVTVLGTLGTVPEPATMALLGLGALVLRRKK